MPIEFNDNGLADERHGNVVDFWSELRRILGEDTPTEVIEQIQEAADEFAEAEHRRLDAYNTAETAMRGGLG